MKNKEINQKKKQILLKILDTLTEHWDIAKGIYVLVQDADPDDAMIDNLLNIMKTAMINIEDSKAKEKMEEGLNILKKMQNIEKEERLEELKSLESSLNQIDKFL